MVKKILKHEVIRFILVGIFNTALGIAAMFCFYHFFGWGYWGSSALSYTLGSIISFFLHKNFTFQQRDTSLSAGLKFAVNMGVCYFAAYLLAKPLVRYFLFLIGVGLRVSMLEQIALLVGMALFMGLNFLGQKLWVFYQEGGAQA